MQHDSRSSRCNTLLIADDHEVLRHGLVELLRCEFSGARILQAARFEDALKLAETPNLDLVIVDLIMPGMPGPEALTVLRRKSPDAKIVVLSASEKREDIIASLAAGVHGYILKTASADALIDQLKQVLAGKIYVPPIVASIADAPLSPLPANLQGGDDLLSRFTPRQIEVLSCIELGMTNKEIARELQLSSRTIKMHVTAVLQILGVRNRTQAAAVAQQWTPDRNWKQGV